MYASKHGDMLPPDLYTAMLALGDAKTADNPAAVRELAGSSVVSPAHAGLLTVPAEVTPAWVNESSSYRYLGNGEIKWSDIPDWGSIVIAHLRLDAGLKGDPTPESPEGGEIFSLGFLDGHASVCGRAGAERLIAKSAQTLDALRRGTDPPDDRLAVQNLTLVMRAVRAYAAAHEGMLPGDLGATLAYVPGDTRVTGTPQQRARIYLSPRAIKNTHIPEEPTAEWVLANCRYIYVGAADVALADIPEAQTLAMLAARAEDGFTERGIKGREEVMVPVATVGGEAATRPQVYAEWIIAQSRRTVEAVRPGAAAGALPDWVRAARDMSLIGRAVVAYAADHEDRLPPDLGATLAYLPKRIPGMPGALGAGASARGAVFLSARAEATTEVPENPTAEWVTRHASYLYIGSEGAPRVADITAVNGGTVLVHGPLGEPFKVMFPGVGLEEVVPYSDALGMSILGPKEWVEKRIAESRRVLSGGK